METNKDIFGNELKAGDNICFKLSLGRNNHPLVRAKVKEIKGNWAFIDSYTENADTECARLINKLNKKVEIGRVVKCF